MNELEKKAKKVADTMKEQGYEVSNDFALNFVTLKEKDPNISNEELLEQTFKKTLAFYDDFNKNPKPYTNEIHRQLIEEELNEKLNKIGLKADIYETDDWIDEDRMYEGKIVTNDSKEIECDESLTGRYVDLNSVKEELEGYMSHNLKKEVEEYYQKTKENNKDIEKKPFKLKEKSKDKDLGMGLKK